MAEWCTFRLAGPSKSGKTQVWAVESIAEKGGDDPQFVELGAVKWYGAWRKYAFFPAPQTLFEHDCLRQIADFCESETKTQRRTSQTTP
jgi:hypothetical protein